MISAVRDNHSVTRNISLFKKYFPKDDLNKDLKNQKYSINISNTPNSKQNIGSEVFMDFEKIENGKVETNDNSCGVHDNEIANNIDVPRRSRSQEENVNQTLLNVANFSEQILQIIRDNRLINQGDSIEINPDGSMRRVNQNEPIDQSSIAIQATITVLSDNSIENNSTRRSSRLADKPKPQYKLNRSYNKSGDKS
ncbi:unnamed protein product [Brachionus calyciflorus]|uniref:Uncharacterized protein n=1 Tax=Brachionus calyciflorus TaxID=104777 RepID=A0A814RX50_9BILA|nr:unnamed protein product [Brachionus calyciflorus]